MWILIGAREGAENGEAVMDILVTFCLAVTGMPGQSKLREGRFVLAHSLGSGLLCWGMFIRNVSSWSHCLCKSGNSRAEGHCLARLGS